MVGRNCDPLVPNRKIQKSKCFIWCRLGTRKPFFLSPHLSRTCTDVKDVMDVLDYGEESISVAMEEVKARDWVRKVYEPDSEIRFTSSCFCFCFSDFPGHSFTITWGILHSFAARYWSSLTCSIQSTTFPLRLS